MGKLYEEITTEIAEWVEQQRMFFVATAPLSGDGHINCSPKGMDTFRILGPQRVGYLDLTGSGAETIAHLRENGRIVFMFCGFEGKPQIVRFYGQGRTVLRDDPEWQGVSDRFPESPGARSIVVADLDRITDSCGFSVPEFEYRGDRQILKRWAENKGPEGIERYWAEKNSRSIDGLPALDPQKALTEG